MRDIHKTFTILSSKNKRKQNKENIPLGVLSEEIIVFIFSSSSNYSLGSHRIFQKDKSVIQLNLQKNREAPGKLSRKVRLS